MVATFVRAELSSSAGERLLTPTKDLELSSFIVTDLKVFYAIPVRVEIGTTA